MTLAHRPPACCIKRHNPPHGYITRYSSPHSCIMRSSPPHTCMTNNLTHVQDDEPSPPEKVCRKSPARDLNNERTACLQMYYESATQFVPVVASGHKRDGEPWAYEYGHIWFAPSAASGRDRKCKSVSCDTRNCKGINVQHMCSHLS